MFGGVLKPKLNEQGPRHYQPGGYLPSSEIYFDVDTKNFASIRSGSSYFKILGLPEEEFPSLARFEEAKIFTIAQKDLKDGLKKTFYAISTDQTRYVLNGILLSFKDNKLTPGGDGWPTPGISRSRN